MAPSLVFLVTHLLSILPEEYVHIPNQLQYTMYLIAIHLKPDVVYLYIGGVQMRRGARYLFVTPSWWKEDQSSKFQCGSLDHRYGLQERVWLN